MSSPLISLKKLLWGANQQAAAAGKGEDAFTLAAGSADYKVSEIVIDSREAVAGSLFVALRGAQVDSHRFVSQMLAKGVAVVVDQGYYEECGGDVGVACGVGDGGEVSVVVVRDTREFLPYLACTYFDSPSHQLRIVAITGTNGKTTTCHVIESLLRKSDALQGVSASVGVLGTIAHRWPGFSVSSVNTTPESLLLQRYFWLMRRAEVSDVVMEASSHALAGSRLEGVAFDVMVFTNLTQDHLDFHGTMQSYKEAKGRLFSDFVELSRRANKQPVAIVNACDPVAAEFQALAQKHGATLFTYGIDGVSCDLAATDVAVTKQGTRCKLCVSDRFASFAGLSQDLRCCVIETPLIGNFNVFNVLAGVAAAVAAGRPFEQVVKVLPQLDQVPGRLQRVGSQFFVDYAHAPDAVKSVLETMQPLFENRGAPGDACGEKLIIVIGAGGDRDRSKRRLMGEIAGRYADYVIVTNDNPRSEDPMAIATAVAEGARSTQLAQVEIILDRKKAIKAAVAYAHPHDLVVIAGKGHETYQEIQGVRTSFSDVEVLKSAIQALGQD